MSSRASRGGVVRSKVLRKYRTPGGTFVSFSGGSRFPSDARSLARMHLREIGDRIEKTLKRQSVALDDTTRAHLEECQHRIHKVLDAGLDSNEP